MKKNSIMSILLATGLIVVFLPGCKKEEANVVKGSVVAINETPVASTLEKETTTSKTVEKKLEEDKLSNEKPANEPFSILIKDTNKPLIYPEWGDVKNNELWIKYPNGKEELLVESKAFNDSDTTISREKTIAGIHDPQLSPDKKKIYFMSAAWATSDSIHVVNIQTKNEKYICPGNTLKVIQNGPYSGDLVVSQHRYAGKDKGTTDNYYIVDEEGKEIKNLGEDVRTLVENGFITKEEYEKIAGSSY